MDQKELETSIKSRKTGKVLWFICTLLLQIIISYFLGFGILRLPFNHILLACAALWGCSVMGVLFGGLPWLFILRKPRIKELLSHIIFTAIGSLFPIAIMAGIGINQGFDSELSNSYVIGFLPFTSIITGILGFFVVEKIKPRFLSITGTIPMGVIVFGLLVSSIKQPDVGLSSFGIFRRACGSGATSYIVPDGDFFSYIGTATFYQNFDPACNAHDKCYGTCGESRKTCDSKFFDDLNRACKRTYSFWTWNPLAYINPLYYTCASQATAYYVAVDNLGETAYVNAQKKCNNTAEEEFDWWKIKIVNKCNVKMQAAIHYAHMNDSTNWITFGWIPLEPNQGKVVAATRNLYFYVYAESIAPVNEREYWNGNDIQLPINDSPETYGFALQKVNRKEWGYYELDLTCVK